MLTLKKLSLSNFGKHKNFEINFSPGVNGIIGKNMSGKSTVLEAVKFALTGNLDMPLQSYINREAGKHAAKVALEFATASGKGVVERAISNTGPAKTRLATDCGFETTKAKEANLFFAENLGAAREAVLDAVFIKQGELASEGLFGPPAKRLEFFQKLAGLSDLPKISDSAARVLEKLKLSQINIPSPEELSNLRDQIALAKNEAQKIQQNLLALEAEKEAYVSRFLFDLSKAEEFLNGEIKSARDTLIALQNTEKELKASSGWSQKKQDAFKEKLLELQKLANVQKMAAAKQAALAGLAAVRDKLRDGSLQKQAEEFDPSFLEKIETSEKLLEKCEQAACERDELERQSAGLKQQADNLELKIETAEVQIAAFQLYLNNLEKEQAAKNAAKILAETAKDGVCPLCGKPGFEFCEKNNDNLQEDLALAKDSLNKLQIQKNTLERDLLKLRMKIEGNKTDLEKLAKFILPDEQIVKIKNVVKMKSWFAERKQAKEQFDACLKEAEKFEEILKSLGNEVPDAPDPQVLEKLTETEAELKKLEEIGKKLCVEIPAAIQSAQTLLDQKIEQLNSVVREKEEIKQKIPPAAFENPRQWLEQIRAEKQNLISAQAVIESVEKIFFDREQVLQKFKNVADKIEKLELIKTAFSKNGIPRILSDKLFENLCAAVSAKLAAAGADFSVQKMPDEPVSFQFLEDGWWMPQDKLSGGGRVRLACAFLISLRNTILPATSLLVLDEPSLHLDETGVEILRNMLSEISANVQIIVCDHNPMLFPSFAKTVSLT